MTPEENIERALFDRVVAADFGGLPIAWPNVPFPAPGQDKPTSYVEVVHFRNVNTRLFLKGTNAHLRQGILQLTVITPLHGGPEPATRQAGEIAAQFPADLALYSEDVSVRVDAAPDVLSADRTDVSWDVPVSIHYHALV